MNQFLPKKMLFALVLMICSIMAANAQTTPVAKYGQLQIKNGKVSDKNGNPVVLRGMSLFWSGFPEGIPYYNATTIKWLRDDWCVDVIRIPMAVETGNSGNYLSNPSGEYNKVKTVIDACIANGLYVIVDFHSHKAEDFKTQAKKFFSDIATEYGNKPNILYEPYNEPLDHTSWSGTIKPYHNELISTIRAIDPDNIIICGTRSWSQQVDEAANDQVTGTNIAYTLHYYAGGTSEHRQLLRDKVSAALSRGVAIFATEYGTVHQSGNGNFDATESQKWWDFLEANKIGSCNWSVTNKSETSAAIQGTSAISNWSTNQLTQSGNLVRNYIKSKCNVAVTTGSISLAFAGNKTTYNVGETVTINATATVSNGVISKVEFFRNGMSIGIKNAGTAYSVSFVATAAFQGGHDITAKLYDANGALIAESPIYNITVVGASDISSKGVTDQFETDEQFSELTGAVNGTSCATATDAAAVGIYWWEDKDVATPFKAELTRPGDGTLEYLLSQAQGGYGVFGFSFGEYCDGTTKKKYTMDLSDNAEFKITVSTPLTNTATLDLKFQLKDINGNVLAIKNTVLKAGVVDAINWYKHEIGYSKNHLAPDYVSLAPGETSNFVFDFKTALSVNNPNNPSYPADINTSIGAFDFKNVVDFIMVPVNKLDNGVTGGYKPLAFADQKIIFSGLTLGNPALGTNFCSTPKTVTATGATYCQNDEATELTATGTTGLTLKWYATSTGGTASTTAPTPQTTTVGDVDYFVSQAVPGSATCEGPRTAVKVTIDSPPASDAGVDQNIGTASTAALSGSGDEIGTWELLSAPAGATVAFTPSASVASPSVSGLSAEGAYSFAYTVGTGTCSSVDIVIITVTGIATGTSDAAIESKVDIYPNPVSSDLNINMSRLTGAKSVKVVDMMGRVLVEKSNVDLISVDMNNLSQGMYLIQIQTESGSVVKSVMKK